MARQISIFEVQDVTIENGPTNVEVDYNEAKKVLAGMIFQTQKGTWHSMRYYQDRMVMATIPSIPGTNKRNCDYADCVTCIANGGENSINGTQVGFFSPYGIDCSTYLYKAQNGDYMLAECPEDGETVYYRVYIHEY